MIRKAAALMIENDKGEILLSRKGPKSRYEPGKWELCGGAVDEGEDYISTARREALEELGIKAVIGNVLSHDVYPDMGDGVEWEVKVFSATTQDIPEIMEPEKCVELRWVDKNKLRDMKDDLAVHLKKDLKKLELI